MKSRRSGLLSLSVQEKNGLDYRKLLVLMIGRLSSLERCEITTTTCLRDLLLILRTRSQEICSLRTTSHIFAIEVLRSGRSLLDENVKRIRTWWISFMRWNAM